MAGQAHHTATERDARKELADTLIIHVASNLTWAQSSVLREGEECRQASLLQKWMASLQQQTLSQQLANTDPTALAPRAQREPPLSTLLTTYDTSAFLPLLRWRAPAAILQQQKEQQPQFTADVSTIPLCIPVLQASSSSWSILPPLWLHQTA